MKTRSSLSRLVLSLFALALVALTNCAHRSEDGMEKPRKPRKPKKVRDPVEQRIFYDGWGWNN